MKITGWRITIQIFVKVIIICVAGGLNGQSLQRGLKAWKRAFCRNSAGKRCYFRFFRLNLK